MKDKPKRRYLVSTPPETNVVSIDTRPVEFPKTNADFLVSIFGVGQVVQSMNFRGNPSDKNRKGGFKGKWEVLPRIGAKDETSSNTYYCISTFRKNSSGDYQRSKGLFKECFVIPVDDVGTKGVPLSHIVEKLRPSYVIETSEGNYQVGYILDRPCKDADLVTRIIKTLNNEHGDKGCKGVNRVVRLPYGVHGGKGNFKVHFDEEYGWSGIRYSVEEIIEAFGIQPREVEKPTEQQNVGDVRKLTFDELFEHWSSDKVDKPDVFAGDPNTGEPDLSKYGGDWSSADQALVNHLYKWFQGNPDYIDRVFRKSALMRDKWERDDYREMTIKKASVGKDGQPTPIYDPDLDLTTINPALRYGKSGTIMPTLSNAVVLLKQEGIDLSFDEFLEVELLNGKPTTDNDITAFIVLMETKYGVEFTTEKMNKAMAAVALSNSFDSLRDYVTGLTTWDGTDYIDLLCDKMGVALDIHRLFMRKQLIGSIARAMVPGSKVDTAAILLGPQGTGKSTFIRCLCPDSSWFDDTISGRLGKADEIAKTHGRWHVELAELSSLNRTTDREAKQFMSLSVDRYRSPYGKKVQEHPRRFVYWGSTNEDLHLSDTTGNRRYFPIDCAKPMEAAKWLMEGKNRDLLWSQAFKLWQDKEPWWLTGEEAAEQASLTEQHRKKSFVEQQLTEWFEEGEGCFKCQSKDEPDEDGIARKHFVKVTDVQASLAGLMRTPPSVFHISEALRLMGWVEHPKITHKGKKPSPYKYKEGGRTISAPRGVGGPMLDTELEPMTRAERARRIVREYEK